MALYIPSLSDLIDSEIKAEYEKETENNEELTEDKKFYAEVKKIINNHEMHRLLSEAQPENKLDFYLEKGVSYHVISHGNIDSLTYFRWIIRQQPIKYALISTWCMALTDIEEVFSWIERGYLKRCDFYVGEIFKGSYHNEYNLLFENCKKYHCRMTICRNHSKVMVLYGERFNAVIESSANVNTNPRIEQTCITVDDTLCDFYKGFFDGLKSFERYFDDIKPYEV